MRLVGEVKVIEAVSKKVIAQETNIVVDGGGKTICDMLTMPPGLLDNANTSSILDASNYTIRALSYGKHGADWALNSASTKKAANFITSSLNGGANYVPMIPAFVSANNVSSYTTVNRLPKAPTPMDFFLDKKSNFSGLETCGTHANPVSGSLSSFPAGQLTNLIPYYAEVCAAGLEPFAVSGYALSALRLTAYRMGCFGASDVCTPYINVYSSTATSPATANIITRRAIDDITYGGSGTISGMDFRGYSYVADSSLSNSGYVSVDVPSDYLTALEVKYKTRMHKNDLVFCSLYGGFTSLGLWTIDLKATLLNAQPPFVWHPVNHPFEFRLFSKKVFSQNLANLSTRIRDGAAYSVDHLTIEWTLKFKR